MTQISTIICSIINTIFLLVYLKGAMAAFAELKERGYRRRKPASEVLWAWALLVAFPLAMILYQVMNGFVLMPIIQAFFLLCLIGLNFAARQFPFWDEIESSRFSNPKAF